MMEKYLSQDFWLTNLSNGIDWLLAKGPTLIIILVLWAISIWLYTRIVARLKKGMLKAAKRTQLEESMLEKEKRINTLTNILRQGGKVAIWVVFFLVFLRNLGLNIGPILASAGILGLAIGFGAQELVRDFISGFFILLENQVREGDVAIINGTGGLVESIALRTITLRDFGGVVHIFQNGKINTLSNMTKEWSAMVFDVGVAYKENIDQVKEVIAQVGATMENDPEFKDKIMNPLEIFGVDKFADSAVMIKARIKTNPGDQWIVGREFNGRLKKAFDKAGIEIPFPHQTVYWGETISPLKISQEK